LDRGWDHDAPKEGSWWGNSPRGWDTGGYKRMTGGNGRMRLEQIAYNPFCFQRKRELREEREDISKSSSKGKVIRLDYMCI
jgi:hypothetical protein